MRSLTSLPIAVLLVSVLLGCSEDKPAGPSATDVFPQAVGSRWTYWVYYSANDDGDTVDVEIVMDFDRTEGSGTLWRVTPRTENFAYGQGLYRNGDSFVVTRGDSVHFYDERPGSPPYLVLILPLSVGKHWNTRTSAESDASFVAAHETFEVPAGVFEDSWRLERLLMWEDCGLESEYQVVPDVGFIKSESAIVGAVCLGGTTTWELLSYSIPVNE